MEYLYAAVPMRVVPSKNHDDLSKDQLLNDVTNTGVAAALIGGFALMGGGCYIASVIALSFEALQYIPVFRYLCLGIGLMSMSVVLLTFARVHS